MGHHFGHFRIRVWAARIDGGPPMYWIYDNRTNGRVGNDGGKLDFDTHVPIRDLRKAKRLVEKWMKGREENAEVSTQD